MFESDENVKLTIIRDLYLRGILQVIDEKRRTELINKYDKEMLELSEKEREDFYNLKDVKNILRIINKYRLMG